MLSFCVKLLLLLFVRKKSEGEFGGWQKEARVAHNRASVPTYRIYCYTDKKTGQTVSAQRPSNELLSFVRKQDNFIL